MANDLGEKTSTYKQSAFYISYFHEKIKTI